jgi:hypothetical protein
MGVGKLISGTLNADEVFMGPSGHIYLGINYASELSNARIQLDSSGIRAYNGFGTALAEFLPGGFNLRTGVDGARLSFGATTGMELFDASGARTGYLSPLGVFQLDSVADGARTRLDSVDGITFTAAATRNLAYNPGFINSSDKEAAVAGTAVDDQVHVYAGDYAVKFSCNNASSLAPSYVDVPFKNTVGTGTTVAASRVNACPNPGFQVNSTGWLGSVINGVGPTLAAVLGFVNTTAIQVSANIVAQGRVWTPQISVLAAQQWAMSASVRITSAATVTAEIIWYDSGGVELLVSPASTQTLPGNTVRQVGVVAVAPINAVTAALRLSVPMQVADLLQVTDAMYEQASSIGPYADGNQSGWQWVGTPGLSTSSLTPVPVPDPADNLVSIYVWAEVACWVHIEGRDSTAGVSRGSGAATRVTANRWNRVQVACSGIMDKVRLHFPSSDQARQTRLLDTPLWWSALQVEASRTNPTPFCSGSEPGCRWEGAIGRSVSIRNVDTIVTQISPNLGVTASGAINGGSLTAASFFAGRIFGTYIQSGTLKGNIIEGNLINGDQILFGTLRGTSISARTIDASSIKTGTLTAAEISAGTITGDRMVAGTIQATQIGANAVTAEKINAGSVTADKMQANMVISQRIIAGAAATGARVELTPAMGLQAFASNGTRTVWIDSATGAALMTGTIRTALTGTRIEMNPGGNTPDTIRLYQTDGTFGIIFADPAGGGSGVFIAGSGANSGKLLAYNGESAASFVSGGVSRSAVSCIPTATNVWGGTVSLEGRGQWGSGETIIGYRNGSGNVVNSRTLFFRGAGSGEAALFSPQYNVQLVWTTAGLVVQDIDGLGRPLIASNVAASSRRMKKNEKKIKFKGNKVIGDIIDALEPKEWNYNNEYVEGETPPVRTYTVPGDILRDNMGRMRVNPDGSPMRSPDQTVAGSPPDPVKPRFGLIAEEVQEVLPEIVQNLPDSVGGLGLAERDLVSLLWLAMRDVRQTVKNLRDRIAVLEGKK